MTRFKSKLPTGTNYGIVEKLKGVVENKDLRHLIITSNILLGSCYARKEKPERFEESKIFIGRIYEASKIAETGQRILYLLKTNSPEDVYRTLEEEIKKIDTSEMIEAGLYKYFKHFKSKENKIRVGERLEELLARKYKYKLNGINRQKKRIKIFSIEADRISLAFFNETENIIRHPSGFFED